MKGRGKDSSDLKRSKVMKLEPKIIKGRGKRERAREGERESMENPTEEKGTRLGGDRDTEKWKEEK